MNQSPIQAIGYISGIKDPHNSTFKVAHNILRSHAKAYHTYCDKFKSTQKGKYFAICTKLISVYLLQVLEDKFGYTIVGLIYALRNIREKPFWLLAQPVDFRSNVVI